MEKEALEHLAVAFTNKLQSATDDYEEQIAALYQQIGQLKVENDFLKKNAISLALDRRSMLDPSHPQLSLRKQCELLNVNRSSYYYAPAPPNEDLQALMRIVDEIYTEYPFFGTRQMSRYLKLNGHDVARGKVRTAYEHLGLRSVSPGPHTSKPHPEHKIYPYLLRDVTIAEKDQVWSTDITYLRMRKGFVYLMAIIDWYSRYVLEWQLSISMEADFCVEALSRALSYGKCSIFNTDQGSQFTSTDFTDVLKAHQVDISMDGKGRWVDNVFVERLWRSVKYECTYLYEWNAVSELRQALRQYFHFYNHKRPHQSLGGQTPGSVYLV